VPQITTFFQFQPPSFEKELFKRLFKGVVKAFLDGIDKKKVLMFKTKFEILTSVI
jgi:hypothetical protein